MGAGRADWENTTHDWSSAIDPEHLALIRRHPKTYAPNGPAHLVLEVLAYAVDEAAYGESPSAVVTLHPDGSISVADNGRGTDTRLDADGQAVRKPVMATEDLRFFAVESPPLLSDGYPRRGMSVVSALSSWLVHTNRRRTGSWTQRYEHGLPITDLTPIADDGSTGTTVRFRPDPGLVGVEPLSVRRLRALIEGKRSCEPLIVNLVLA